MFDFTMDLCCFRDFWGACLSVRSQGLVMHGKRLLAVVGSLHFADVLESMIQNKDKIKSAKLVTRGNTNVTLTAEYRVTGLRVFE